MITLDQILKAEFADANLDEITGLLQQHNLYTPIIDGLGIINGHFKSKSKEIQTFGFPQISHIAACVLIRINEYFSFLNSQQRLEEKENLQYVCGSIFRRCLQILVMKMPINSRELFSKSLYITLQDTCKIYGYDFNELLQIFSIVETANEKQAIQKATSSQKVNPEFIQQIPGYSWLGNEDKEDLFFQLFAETNICNKSEFEKFKSLFKSPKENLSINFNKQLVNFTLQFFFFLKSTGLVTYYGCKGFYQVLQFHVVDFDAVFLHNKTPQRAMGFINKHSSWIGNQRKLKSDFKTIL